MEVRYSKEESILNRYRGKTKKRDDMILIMDVEKGRKETYKWS